MESLKPKILLLPAWFPASFFIEQMKLVEDFFEFRVLVGERHELGKKKALKKILSGNFQQFSWNTSNLCYEKKEIINVEYHYINSLSPILERKQYKHLNKCFANKFQELIENEWKPDIIHIQSLSDTAVFICNWAEKHKIPVILTEHIIYIRRKFDFFEKEKEKVYSRVNKVLCVSNYVYRNLLTTGIALANPEIIGNLVNDSLIPDNFEAIIKNNKIIFVASHFHDKDIHVLLDTAKLLLNSGFCNFEIDVVGLDASTHCHFWDKEYFSFKEVLMVNGLEKNIHILEKKERKEILEMYKYYIFLISTSLSETFGLAAAEAITNGLPVVCTDSGGIRDFVNETNGLIVQIRNPQKLANAIKDMFEKRHMYNASEMSAKMIIEYGTKAFRNRLLQIYDTSMKD
jgi:glycosyltransferase involved in cell wall biosynthesis